MIVGMLSAFVFLMIFIFTIIWCIAYPITKRKSLTKENLPAKIFHKSMLKTYSCSILLSTFIIIISYTYSFNQNINLKINSALFSDKYFTFFYNNDVFNLRLPPNSICIHKIPDNLYYNSHSIDECVKFLDNEYREEKEKCKIDNFNFSNNKYEINYGRYGKIIIDFKEETESRTYFTVLYSK